MRENRTQGSARGLLGNWQSYLNDRYGWGISRMNWSILCNQGMKRVRTCLCYRHVSLSLKNPRTFRYLPEPSGFSGPDRSSGPPGTFWSSRSWAVNWMVPFSICTGFEFTFKSITLTKRGGAGSKPVELLKQQDCVF